MPSPQRPSPPLTNGASLSSARSAAPGSGAGRRLPPQLWTTKSMILLSTCVASSAYLFGLFQGFEKGKAVAARDMAAAPGTAAAAAGGGGAAQQQEMDKMRNDPSAAIYAGR